MAICADKVLLHASGQCAPYACPGTYVPDWVGFEEVVRRQEAEEAKIPKGDRAGLVRSPWFLYQGCDFPWPAWPAAKKAAATKWRNLTAEVMGRRTASASTVLQWEPGKGGYRDWTTDRVCNPCAEWIDGPWDWRGVKSFPLQFKNKTTHVITCGMLKDFGRIENAEQCEVEKADAIQAYVKWREKKARERAKKKRNTAIAVQVVMGAMTIATGYLAGPVAAIATAAMQKVPSIATSGDSKAITKFGLSTLADLVAAGLPGGSVLTIAVSATQAGLEVSEAIEARKDAKEDLKKAAKRIDVLNQALADAVTAREELDVIEARTKALQDQINATKSAMGASAGTLGLVALGVVALYFLSGRAR